MKKILRTSADCKMIPLSLISVRIPSSRVRRKQPPPKKLAMFKEVDELYCKGLMTANERLGIRFRELEFGESIINDFYKHGKLLKKKLDEHAKGIGMHLPRSKRRVKIVDEDVEMLKTMKINTIEVTAVGFSIENWLRN